MPVDRKDQLVAEKAAKGGLRARIDAMCIHCLYDPEDRGRWRQQVAACTSTGCPLWPVRAGATKA